jgi:crotonobetainyl-CoA:carnitine CoA-transferase CaiB-like acyl-CoA transferase
MRKNPTQRPTRTSTDAFRQGLAELAAVTGRPLDAGKVRFGARAVSLDTPFRAAEAAAAALAAGAVIAGDLTGRPDAVRLDSRHVEASLLSFAHLRFLDPGRGLGPRVPGESRTAAAGFYPTRDGRWVYLHSGFPHNTRGLLSLLGVEDDRKAVRRAIRRWRATDLEDRIADAGLCGAMVRSAAQWDESPPGKLLGSRPVVEIVQVGDSDPEPVPGNAVRPLTGTRVLDLTRILAGPTCARTLAGYGADVLRVGGEHLPSIPLFVADTGFGKRACHLDLRRKTGTERLKRLVRQADVFSQGYRSGAMERLGFGVADVVGMRPGIVYVSINCYGHEGAWRPRPGWEQLAQTVTGMAAAQGDHLGLEEPTLLPAAVNDYTTGYLAAVGALAALALRAEHGGSYWVRVSLARTAMWVRSLGTRPEVRPKPMSTPEIGACSAEMDSAWGPLGYLRPAVGADRLDIRWARPPSPLGADRAVFSQGVP